MTSESKMVAWFAIGETTFYFEFKPEEVADIVSEWRDNVDSKDADSMTNQSYLTAWVGEHMVSNMVLPVLQGGGQKAQAAVPRTVMLNLSRVDFYWVKEERVDGQ